MGLLLCGNITNKMKYIYLLLITLSIISCDKEKCYTIEGKEIINGDYYFFILCGPNEKSIEDKIISGINKKNTKIKRNSF